jgi:putative PIN family toxin of toxin-antitoxin system
VTVVFDSNVWISALNYGGAPRLALESATATDQIAISDFIIAEIVRILVEKMNWEPHRVPESLSIYLRDAERIVVKGTLHGVCRDPKDDMVLECAVTAGAKAIISGDKDLLSLESYEGIRILSPRAYLSDQFDLET